MGVAKIGSIGGRAAAAAGLGAVSAVGTSEEESAQGLAKDAAVGAALGGAFQYGGDKLAPVISKGFDKLKGVGSKLADKIDDTILPGLGKVTAGIEPEDTRYYLQNSKKINAETGSIETVKSDVDDFISGVLGQREKAQAEFSGAKDVLKAAEQSAKDSLADERYMTSLLRSQAKEQFDDQSRRAIEGLEKKTLAPLNEKILQGMEELKAKVGQQSGEAFEILDKAWKKSPGASVPLSSVLGEIDNGLKNLTIGGTTISDSATQSARALS